jgi:hypothetical protein
MQYIGMPISKINRAELLHVVPVIRNDIIVDISAYNRNPLYLPYIYYHSMDINEIIDEDEINRVYNLYRELMGAQFTCKADILAIFARHNISITNLYVTIMNIGEIDGNDIQIACYMYGRYNITVNSAGFICDIKRG